MGLPSSLVGIQASSRDQMLAGLQHQAIWNIKKIRSFLHYYKKTFTFKVSSAKDLPSAVPA
jgi:hypothetical protein